MFCKMCFNTVLYRLQRLHSSIYNSLGIHFTGEIVDKNSPITFT